METGVVVALIAAAASVVGAWLSRRSAHSADKTSREVAGLGHQIVALDRQIDTFRGDYERFMLALAPADGFGAVAFGAALVAGDILRANPLTDDVLDGAIERLGDRLSRKLQQPRGEAMQGVDTDMRDVREAVRAILNRAGRERVRLIAERKDA